MQHAAIAMAHIYAIATKDFQGMAITAVISTNVLSEQTIAILMQHVVIQMVRTSANATKDFQGMAKTVVI